MAPDLSRAHADESRSGFVVVAVLWILAALALLVGVFAVYVSVSAASMGMHADQVRFEAAVRGALELVAHQMNATDDRARLIGSVGFRLDRANVVAGFRGESARIDLNKAPKELLAGLFRSLGRTTAEAEDHAARIDAWRKRTQTGTTSEEVNLYRDAGLRYVPRESAFPHVAELANILRMPDALVAQLMPFVTVYSDEAGINIDIAAPEVIGALPGMSREKLAQLLEARRLPGSDRTVPALLGADARYTTANSGAAMRVSVRADFGNGKRSGAEVVIVTLTGDSEPYRVLSWTDDIEPEAAKTMTSGGVR